MTEKGERLHICHGRARERGICREEKGSRAAARRKRERERDDDS